MSSLTDTFFRIGKMLYRKHFKSHLISAFIHHQGFANPRQELKVIHVSYERRPIFFVSVHENTRH